MPQCVSVIKHGANTNFFPFILFYKFGLDLTTPLYYLTDDRQVTLTAKMGAVPIFIL